MAALGREWPGRPLLAAPKQSAPPRSPPETPIGLARCLAGAGRWRGHEPRPRTRSEGGGCSGKRNYPRLQREMQLSAVAGCINSDSEAGPGFRSY
jgi:hypothetical protein